MSGHPGANDDEGVAHVRDMIGRDRASAAMGMRLLAVSRGRASVTMSVRDDMLNGHAICHGGCIFSVADTAFAAACNTSGVATVAAGVSIEFLRPAMHGDELIANAVERHRSGRTGYYDVTVTNQRGDVIALFTGRARETGGLHAGT